MSTKKVVIITGANDGIGLACTKLFLENGYIVCGLDIYNNNLHQISENSKYGDLYYYRCDITKTELLQSMIIMILGHFGRMDCLVNNAGVHPPVISTKDFSVNDFRKNVEINLTSNYVLCQAVMNELIKNNGTIVFVTSMVAINGQNQASAYCASKAGQIGLLKSLAVELSPNVRVNGVAPSNVLTSAMTKWLNTFDDPVEMKTRIGNVQKLKRMAEPKEIAEIVYFLASDKSSFITGQVIEADGGAQLDYH